MAANDQGLTMAGIQGMSSHEPELINDVQLKISSFAQQRSVSCNCCRAK